MHCGKQYGNSIWNYCRFLKKKIRIELSYYLAILLLGIYLKNTKILIWKDICTHIFTAALFTTVKQWKQPKYLSQDEWIKKIDTHTYTVEYFSNPTVCDNMAGPWRYCAKWNKSEKDKYHMISLIGGYKNKWTNKYNKNTLLDTENRLVIVSGYLKGMGLVGGQNGWRESAVWW